MGIDLIWRRHMFCRMARSIRAATSCAIKQANMSASIRVFFFKNTGEISSTDLPRKCLFSKRGWYLYFLSASKAGKSVLVTYGKTPSIVLAAAIAVWSWDAETIGMLLTTFL